MEHVIGFTSRGRRIERPAVAMFQNFSGTSHHDLFVKTQFEWSNEVPQILPITLRWVISGPASQEDVPLRYNLVDVKKSEVDEEMTL